jgi:hypothetical protein
MYLNDLKEKNVYNCMYATIEDFTRENEIYYTQICILEMTDETGVKKLPIYEQNHLTPDEIRHRNKTKTMTMKSGATVEIKQRPDFYSYKGKTVRTKAGDVFHAAHSLYLKHTPDMFCIDVDDITVKSLRDFAEICGPDLRPFLADCLYIKGNTKGLHIYARVCGVPEYSDQIDVFKSFRGDLIHRTNMWEKVDKFVYRGFSEEPLPYGAPLSVSVLQFDDIKHIFKDKLTKGVSNPRALPKAAGQAGDTSAPLDALTLGDCKNECQMLIFLGYEHRIFASMCGFTTWRNLAFICAAECGDLGRTLFTLISKQYEPEKYDEMNVLKFYEGAVKTAPAKPLTVASLRRLYKKTDPKVYAQICARIKKAALADDYVPPTHDVFDSVYFHTLTTYTQQKRYFELFCAKILRPECLYVYCETENGEKVPITYRDVSLRETFAHLVCADDDDDGGRGAGEPVQFVKRWMRDPELRMFQCLDFQPHAPGQRAQDTRVYNLFTGYSAACKMIDKEDAAHAVARWLDLVFHVCGADRAAFEYLVALFAHTIQYPDERPGGGICTILKGRQGVGKNMLLNAFAAVIGSALYYASADVNDFFGTHANGMFRRLVCVYNEAELKDSFDIEGKVKAAITEPHATLNEKYQKAMKVRNFARFFLTTNKPNSVRIDVKSGDRRFFVVEADAHYLAPEYDAGFWSSLKQTFESPEHIAALYTYLMSYDISAVDWKRRPLTVAYKKMCAQFIPVESLFIEALAAKHGPAVEYMRTSRDLYTEWELFCNDHGFNGRFKNIQQLAASIDDLGVPIEKRRGVDWMYAINLHRALNVLRGKGLAVE